MAPSTTLTLNHKLELIRAGAAPFSSSLTVSNNAVLNVGTANITVGTDDGNVGNNATFNLNAGSTFITANTGVAPNTAIEGAATDGTTGSILAGTTITKNYNAGASYVLNGATVKSISCGNRYDVNLTIGANVSLNKAIIATATLDLASFILKQASKANLQFSGLTSTVTRQHLCRQEFILVYCLVQLVQWAHYALRQAVIPPGNLPSTGLLPFH